MKAPGWIVWAPIDPKPGDVAYYAELSLPVPTSAPRLNLQIPAGTPPAQEDKE